MGWQPIERGKPVVLGVHPRHSGLLRVEIPLTGDVNPVWVERFLKPTGVGIPLSMHPPSIRGRTVEITPPDGELAAYVKHIDVRIEAANQNYAQHDLPRIEQEVQRRAEEEKRERERLQAARRAAEEL